MEKQAAENDSLSAAMKLKNDQIAARQKEVSSLMQTAEEGRQTIAELQKTIADNNEEIAGLKSDLEESQTQIAANLGMSRHRICRRMNAMRRRIGCATLRRLRGNQTAAEAFSLFAFGHCNETPDVRLVIDRLAELSPVELSVLSALLRLLPENETLTSAGISRTWYYRIAAKLSAEFHIALPGRKKVAIADCIRTTDLIPYVPLTEKCTFPSTLDGG